MQQYWNMIRRWIWLLFLSLIVAAFTGYWIGSRQLTVYEASARLLIGPGIDSLNPDLNALRTGGQLMSTYAELATTRPFLESVINELQIETTADKLKKIVDIRTDETSQILSIQIHDTDQAQVVATANAFAEMLVRLSPGGVNSLGDQVKLDMQAQIEEIKNYIAQSDNSIKQLEEQLEVVAYVETRRQLFDQLNQERTQQADARRTLASLYQAYQNSNTNQVRIIELAVDAIPVNSNLILMILMAGMAGLIFALAFILGIEYLRDTIRTADELTAAAGVPVLATIAKHKRLQGIGRKRLVVQALPESQVTESYRLLTSRLLLSRYQTKPRDASLAEQNQSTSEAGSLPDPARTMLHSVVISSAQANEDVSEIAANVAVTLAQTGHNVILVDAYLHRPSIHHLFGVTGQQGLSDILLWYSLTPKSALQKIKEVNTSIQATDGRSELQQVPPLISVDWMPSLQILPGGTPLLNSFKLLVSPHMTDLIKTLESMADIVIIAASPLLSSADSMILASQVDGVVIVANSGKTRYETLKELMGNLHSLNTHILGTILDEQNSSHPSTDTKSSKMLSLTSQASKQNYESVTTKFQSAKL